MSDQIARNSKMIDIVHILPYPIEYVRDVVGNFVSHGYEPETSTIRIGVKGAGIAPNYRIEEPPVRFVLTRCSHRFEMTQTPARTFNGLNHREMRELDDCEWRDENWSADTMTFAEVKTLLSSLS
jgi:hypothetical protein